MINYHMVYLMIQNKFLTSGLGGASPRPSPSDENPGMEKQLQRGSLYPNHPQQNMQHYQQQLQLQQQTQLQQQQLQQQLQQQQQQLQHHQQTGSIQVRIINLLQESSTMDHNHLYEDSMIICNWCFPLII
jgi:hypothetical protein